MWQLEQDDTTTHAGVLYAYLCGESALVDHGGKLERLFEPYGLVDSTQIAPASMGSGARVGFVEMPDTTEAQAAIAGLQGTMLGAQQVTIRASRQQHQKM